MLADISKECTEQTLSHERVSKSFIAPGGKPSIFFAIMMFGQPGVEIIYPEPGFPVYESVINYSGAKAVPMYLSEKKIFRSKQMKF